MNEIFEDFLDNFIRNQDPTELYYSNMIVEKEKVTNDENRIYNEDYMTATIAPDLDSYKAEPRIIELLDRKTINQQDMSGSTPIYYAIELQHIDTIQKLLDCGAYVTTVKNKGGLTPLEFEFKLYEQHLNNYVNDANADNILLCILKPFYEKIEKIFLGKTEYGNNIIRYSDIVFRMCIILYNSYFYSNMKSYVGNWSFESYKSLTSELIAQSIIPALHNKQNIMPLFDLTDNDYNEIITKGTERIVMTEIMDSKLLSNKKTNNKLQQYNSSINNLNKEIQMLKSSTPDEVGTNHIALQLIESLEKKIKKLEDKIKNLDKTIFAPESILLEDKERSNALKQYIERFMDKDSTKYDMDYNIQMYDTIYNNIRNFIPDQRITDKNNLYNKLWELYVKNNKKIANITNIHIPVLIYEKKLITELIDSLKINFTNKNITDKITKFNQIANFYSSILIPPIKNSLELPEYLDQNKLQQQILDIIIHIVKHIFCTNMYNTIIKVLTKYVQTINPAEMYLFDKTKPEYTTYVTNTVTEILGKPNVQGFTKLENHILNVIPKQIVKFTLKKYKEEYDPERKLKTTEDIFGNIHDILSQSTVITLNKDTSAITNIKNVIEPYYIDVITTFIPEMYALLINYNRFIMNNGKHIEIIRMLLNKYEK